MLNPNTIAWAKARGISEDTLIALRAESGTVHMEPGRVEAISWPYFRQGVRVNRKHRALQSKHHSMDKGGELIFFNADTVIHAEPEQVYIVEGEPDLAALMEAGVPQGQILSPPNGAPPVSNDRSAERRCYAYVFEAEAWLSKVKKFVLAGDSDDPGRALRQDLVHLLGPARCYFVDWPDGIKDANDFLMAHGAEALAQYIREAEQEWPVEGLYGLSDIPKPPDLELWHSGWPEWESKLQLTPTLFSVATGYPGHGKSLWTNQLWLQIARRYGIVIAVASLKTRPVPNVRKNLRQMIAGTRQHLMSDAKIAKADQIINDHFRWIVPDGTPTLSWMLDTAEAAVMRHGARAVLLDPWNRINHERPARTTETEWNGRKLDEVGQFARDLNAHLMIVAHPAKPAEHKQRKYPPFLSDISGSQHWENMADMGIAIFRPKIFDDFGKRMTKAEAFIQKNRYADELGSPTSLPMNFNLNTGRFEATSYETPLEAQLREAKGAAA